MLNTKLNLYNAEWLDLVFDKKNKSYGAYDLRQHYAGNLIKAMAFTFGVITAGSLYLKLTTKDIVPAEHAIIVELPAIAAPPAVPVKKTEPPKVQQARAQPKAPAQKFVPYKITEDPVKEEPAKIADLTGDIGVKIQKGDPDAQIDLPADLPEGPINAAPATDNNAPVSSIGLQVQPEPFGGMEAFSKFLGKNLRFPAAAADSNVSGKVIVSFVIERDGSLSNIVIERGAGYGMDQEALRVLRLAKAWKPGIQNGRPVRVRYMIPINFQLPE